MLAVVVQDCWDKVVMVLLDAKPRHTTQVILPVVVALVVQMVYYQLVHLYLAMVVFQVGVGGHTMVTMLHPNLDQVLMVLCVSSGVVEELSQVH